MKRIIFVLFCIILSATSSAQDSRLIKGMVMDTNEMPLSGVTIKGVHSDAITVSKQNGLFEIKVSPYTKHIEASFNGYLPANAEIDGSYIVFKLKIDKDFAKKEAVAKEEAKRIAEREAAVKAKAEKEARLAAEREAAVKAKAEEEVRLKAEAAAKVKAEAEPKLNYEEAVDLGLPSGLKWASCNIGATSPEECGDYFAWGEIDPKSNYSEFNSIAYKKKLKQIVGDGNYDVATARLGKQWYIPTKTDFEELINNCTWTWTTVNGVNGYEVTGSNGNSIFLPSTGYRDATSYNHDGKSGEYWSSTPHKSTEYSYYLCYVEGSYYTFWNCRYVGRCVRPVKR